MDLGKQITVVVCGGYSEYRQYCSEHNISMNDLFTRYASSKKVLLDLKNCRVVYYRNYWNNKLLGHHILDDIQRS